LPGSGRKRADVDPGDEAGHLQVVSHLLHERFVLLRLLTTQAVVYVANGQLFESRVMESV
jgi:hypothetical protein